MTEITYKYKIQITGEWNRQNFTLETELPENVIETILADIYYTLSQYQSKTTPKVTTATSTDTTLRADYLKNAKAIS